MTNTRRTRGRRATASESALRDAVVDFLRRTDAIRANDFEQVANISICGDMIDYRQSFVILLERRPAFDGGTRLTRLVTTRQSLVIRGPRDNSSTETDTLMDGEWYSDDELRLHRFIKGGWINALLAAIGSSWAISHGLH